MRPKWLILRWRPLDDDSSLKRFTVFESFTRESRSEYPRILRLLSLDFELTNSDVHRASLTDGEPTNYALIVKDDFPMQHKEAPTSQFRHLREQPGRKELGSCPRTSGVNSIHGIAL